MHQIDYLSKTYHDLKSYQDQLVNSAYQPDDSDLDLLDDITDLALQLTKRIEDQL